MIGIASDHGGYKLKEELLKYFEKQKIFIADYGCSNLESCDYPVFSKKLCEDLLNKKITWGILICTTGVGMSISANRFENIRAVLAHNVDVCKLSRLHNNANVLCLGAKYVSFENAKEYVEIFIKTPFEGGRHQRRVSLIERD